MLGFLVIIKYLRWRTLYGKSTWCVITHQDKWRVIRHVLNTDQMYCEKCGRMFARATSGIIRGTIIPWDRDFEEFCNDIEALDRC